MSADRSLTLSGFFDVIGREASHTHVCMFDVVTNVEAKVTLRAANRTIANPTTADYVRLTPRPVTGVLRGDGRTFVNTKLDFTTRVTVSGLTSIVTTASTTTDAGGNYVVWIEPGVYDVVIHARSGEIVLNNIKVAGSLRSSFTTTIDGLVSKKIADLVTVNGSDLVQVTGAIVDHNGRPVAGAKFVVLNDGKLLAYVVTADDGLYAFALPRGSVDVQLRGPASSVKVVRNVTVDDDHSFAEQLGANSIIFGRQALLMA